MRPVEVLVELDRGGGPPLRRQLELGLRAAIRGGRLRAGARLPSSRELARQLGVSRGVVVDAYTALGAQGFLDIRPRSAPVVAARPRSPAAASPRAAPASAPAPRYDFIATTPDVSLFPRTAWARAVRHVLTSAPDAALDYGEPQGAPALCRALSEYLGRVRGVLAGLEEIVIVQGLSQAIDLASRVLARRGARRLAFEDPSHHEQWETARLAGLEPVPVPVDGAGLLVERLGGSGAAAVVVTPAHQFPTGAVLEAARRRALLDWAAAAGALVIEDDYDSEFRYDRSPVGTLQGVDPHRVLYIGTASKTLAPALRLGWMAVPQALLADVVQAKLMADAGSPTIDQLALARLFASGAYERAVHHARASYRRRRDALLHALREELPDCRTDGIAAGLHVLLRLPPGIGERAVLAAASARHVRVRALGELRLDPQAPGDAGLLLGYGRLPEAAIAPAVGALAAAVRAVAGA